MIQTEFYLRNYIAYFHNNPVKDGFVKPPEDYKRSSYNALISDEPTLIDRDYVLNLFGGMENFIRFHGKEPENID